MTRWRPQCGRAQILLLPLLELVGVRGFEPPTPCSKGNARNNNNNKKRHLNGPSPISFVILPSVRAGFCKLAWWLANSWVCKSFVLPFSNALKFIKVNPNYNSVLVAAIKWRMASSASKIIIEPRKDLFVRAIKLQKLILCNSDPQQIGNTRERTFAEVNWRLDLHRF